MSKFPEHCNVLIWYDGTEDDFNSDPLIRFAFESSRAIKISVFKKDYSLQGNNAGEAISWPEMALASVGTFPSNYYYFVENDYLHTEDAIDSIYELFGADPTVSYISLADHRDYYHLPIHKKFTSQLYHSKNIIYRDVATTTASFAVRRAVFSEDLPLFLSAKGDFNAFTQLTGIVGRRLIAPIPARAAHCMTNLLPPAVNWDSIALLIENQANFYNRGSMGNEVEHNLYRAT